MFKKLNFGFKTLFSVAVIIALSGAFVLSSCSKDKEEEVEETVETEEVIEAATPAPAPQVEETPSDGAYSGSQGTTETQPTAAPRVRLENQVPPEIAEPCMAKNEGDDCTVVISSGREIAGTCKMARTEQLACMPKARPGTKGSRTK